MKTLSQILFKPALLALVTACGLIAALVSDAAGDMLAWACLAYVCFIGIRYAWPRKRP